MHLAHENLGNWATSLKALDLALEGLGCATKELPLEQVSLVSCTPVSCIAEEAAATHGWFAVAFLAQHPS